MKISYELPIRNPCPDYRAEQATTAIEERPPRIACLLALAHKFQMLVDTGQVRDYAELARLGHITPARLTQIMSLLFLAPDIQEQLLFWRFEAGESPPTERELRRILCEVYWERHVMQSGESRTNRSTS